MSTASALCITTLRTRNLFSLIRTRLSKCLRMSIDGDRSPRKRAQKYVVKRYFGHMLSPRTALRSARHFLALLVQPSLYVQKRHQGVAPFVFNSTFRSCQGPYPTAVPRAAPLSSPTVASPTWFVD